MDETMLEIRNNRIRAASSTSTEFQVDDSKDDILNNLKSGTALANPYKNSENKLETFSYEQSNKKKSKKNKPKKKKAVESDDDSSDGYAGLDSGNSSDDEKPNKKGMEPNSLLNSSDIK